MKIKLLSLLAVVFLSITLFSQDASKEAVKDKVEEVISSTESAKVVDVKEEVSDYTKALEGKTLTKSIFGISILLMFFALIVSLKIYKSGKES